MKKFILFFAAILISGIGLAQTTVTGTVVDSEVGTGLPGATIVVKGTSDGVSSDFNGSFSISVDSGATLVVSYVGYESQEVVVGESANVGIIQLQPGDNILSGVTVFGSVFLAKDRQTPVAVSTLTTSEIEERIGNLELPELLNSTPGVFATGGGGAFGDSRITLRGFQQENIAVLINGMPVNDMENGRVYWSNWAGLTDVVSAMQVQRGLGSSPLPISSVGGTINIVTKSTELSEGGKISVRTGNDNYLKTVVNYNTGKMDNGSALSLLFSRTAGDGYVNGTEFEAYSYFFGYGKESDDGKSNVQFIVTGAPQIHGHRYRSFYNQALLQQYKDFGRKYNYNYGTLDGESFNMRNNFYHKPIASVNWEYTPNDKTTLSTTVYASVGRGGGTGDIGRLYGYQYFSGDLNYNGRYALRNPQTGHVDFDKIYSSNSGQATTFYNGRTYSNVVDAATGLYIVNDQDERVNGVKRNGIIRRASMNSHNWVGGLINLKKQATDNFAYQIGADLRYYKGIHYRRVDNLLGADGYRDFDKYDRVSNGAVITEAVPHNDWGRLWNVFGSTDDDPKIDYHNDGLVSWQGLFGQAEWVTDTYSVFVQGSVANQGFQRVDHFRYAPNDPMFKSEKKNILGGTIKAGANYNIDAKNNVYVNAGYYSKAPNFDAVFQDYDNYVTPDSDLTNEKVVGIEAGYGFRSSDLSMNLNVYRTSWKDRFLSDYVRINGVGGMANYTGVEQVHQGVEFDAKWKISPLVDLEGMLTLGNYEYGSDVTDSNVTNNSGQSIGSATLYLDGEKVGTTAHKTARLNLTVNPSDKFKFNLSLFHADDIFGTVNTEDFQDPEDTTMKLPSYELFDFGSSYTLSIGGKDVYLRFNINNIFDEEYYYMSNNNVFASPGEPTYKGIPLNAKVFPGWGRTYNLGLTYRF
jgi:outer membrane receptor protein involved in Fe transport